MKTPIFNPPSSNLYFSKHRLGLARLQPSLCQSPTWSFQGSNLVNSKAQTSRAPTLYLVQAPTWSLEDSYPLGLQPYLPRHQLCLYEAPTSCFISSRYIWLYLRLPMSSPDNLQLTLHCNLHITSSMTTFSS